MADLTQTAANVSLTDVEPDMVKVGKAAEALTQGNVFYFDSSNEGNQSLATTAAEAKCDGIVLTPAAADEYFAYAPVGATVDLGATLTIGEVYSVSGAVAGAIAPESDLGTGDFPCIIGVASTAGKILIDVMEAGVAKP